MKKNGGFFINILIGFGILLTIGLMMAVPFILTMLKQNGAQLLQKSFSVGIVTGCIYAIALPYVVALFYLKKLYALIYSGRTFSIESANCFYWAGICALSECGVFLLIQFLLAVVWKLVTASLMFWAVTALIPLVCFAAGLIFFSMQRVFIQAAQIKEENDAIF